MEIAQAQNVVLALQTELSKLHLHGRLLPRCGIGFDKDPHENLRVEHEWYFGPMRFYGWPRLTKDGRRWVNRGIRSEGGLALSSSILTNVFWESPPITPNNVQDFIKWLFSRAQKELDKVVFTVELTAPDNLAYRISQRISEPNQLLDLAPGAWCDPPFHAVFSDSECFSLHPRAWKLKEMLQPAAMIDILAAAR